MSRDIVRDVNTKSQCPYRIRPLLYIYNTSFELIEFCRKVIGYGYITTTNRNNPKHSISHRLSLHGPKQIEPLLKQITPHLVSKRRQAEILLEYFARRRITLKGKLYERAYTNDELELLEEIHKLNRGRERGKIPLKWIEKGYKT